MQCAMVEFINSEHGENLPLQTWIETALDEFGDDLEVHHSDIAENANDYYLIRMTEINNEA